MNKIVGKLHPQDNVMNDPQDRSFHKRVEQLESAVTDLQRQVRQLQQTLTDNSPNQAEAQTAQELPSSTLPEPPAPPAQTIPAASQSSSASSTPQFDLMRDGEFWLNKIGIGLLLLGVAFLFKYSVDQGWLTPPVRVGFGLGLGLALLVTGLRLPHVRQPFSQVLLGGSIATWYISGFAAFQLYKLVPYGVAFVFMILVTLLAFGLSARQNRAVLSVIGAAGGLGTPFLLDTGSGSLVGLVGYTCLVIGGTSAIYLVQGWRSLLWTSFVGTWLIFWIGHMEDLSSEERWVLQLGILFGWLAFWALPVIRYLFWLQHPERWPYPASNVAGNSSFQNTTNRTKLHVHLVSVLTPLIALGLSKLIWSLSDQTWGWITIGGAILYGLVAGYLRRRASRKLAYTHTLVAFGLVAIALILLLEGDVLFLALAAEATVLHFLAHRLGDRSLAIAAHFLFGTLGLWFIVRLFDPVRGLVIINPRGLSDLSAIALGLVASTRLRTRKEGQIYWLLLHLTFLGWLWRELSALPDGNVFVTMAWGIYGATLLVVGLRRDLTWLRIMGLGTLLLVVAKLFLIDLAEVKTIWRILLFLGFGGLFLFLSYYFRALWKPTSRPSRTTDSRDVND